MPAPAYSAAEIVELNHENLLPGFGPKPATLGETLAPGSLAQPVLSLSLLSTSPNGTLEVWSGVRYGKEEPEGEPPASTNGVWPPAEPTHPDTVSTGTARLTLVGAQAIADEAGTLDTPWNISSVRAFEPEVIAEPEPRRNKLPGHETALSVPAARLLETKYDLAGLREGDPSRPIFSLSLAVVMGGYSAVAERQGVVLYEPIIMFGAVAYRLRPGDIAPNTTGYWANTAVPVGQFREGVADKDPAKLVRVSNKAGLVGTCAKGLCLAATSRILEDRKRLNTHLPVIATT